MNTSSKPIVSVIIGEYKPVGDNKFYVSLSTNNVCLFLLHSFKISYLTDLSLLWALSPGQSPHSPSIVIKV